MRTLNVGTSEVDVTSLIPFAPGYTVVAINPNDTTAVTLQSAPVSGGTFTALAAVPAGESVEVEIDEPFIRLSAAGNLILLAN